ncbi:MAG: UbiA family prenyltransferase [Candidatus Bathyarchaeota archaeon]|nr:UbiA family prenyltransferase [Candidatus Bathyarchaeota archaeon]
MLRDLKGFAQFISAERGLMLFMISVGAAFLMGETVAWLSAVFLGLIVFCVWSASDAINNFFDVDLDVFSDPMRAEYTKKLGKLGLFIAVAFTAASLALGAVTMVPYVVLFVALGLVFGVVYSVPPFRLRKTVSKPVVNFTVGAVPVLIVAAFFNVFSADILTLVLLIGVTTAVNSLWEDLADYASDFASGSRTIPVIMGFKRGLFFTIIMGYGLIPLMVLVGACFQLGLIYYFALATLAGFVSLRLFQQRCTLFKDDKADNGELLRLGEALAKDFAVVAVIFTLSLMISSLLKAHAMPF